MATPGGSGSDDGRVSGSRKREKKGLRQKLAKALFGIDSDVLHDVLDQEAVIAGLKETGRELHEAIVGLQAELERLRDERVPSAEVRLDRAEQSLSRVQGEVESVRDERLPALENRVDGAEKAGAAVVSALEEVRDRRLPAAVRRTDVLIDRLASQLEETASLVDRVAAREPLPIPDASPDEEKLENALADLGPLMLDRLRGSEKEIAHRMEEYLPLLEGRGPVLDLGCGRGELLGLLREQGIEATGVEADPALAGAARRRGLRVVEGDVLEVLLRLGDASTGAVAAIHLLEHLPAGRLLKVLAEVRRVLEPGGVVLAECPNPGSLRVGADEFWSDPTHVRPLPPRLLELFFNASGFEVSEPRFMRAFPEDQLLPAVDDGHSEAGSEVNELARRVEAMRTRLNQLINGPRDYLLVARRPKEEGTR